MALANYLHIRLDDPTRLRLQEIASERGTTLSKLVRELLYERVRDSSVATPGQLPGKDPTLAELRERAIGRLSDGFYGLKPATRRVGPPPVDWPEERQLQWVRSCIEEIPALVHADPSRVLFELLARGTDAAEPTETPSQRPEEAP